MNTDLMVCPVCGKDVMQRDIESYEEEKTGRELELCNDCREDFEREDFVSLDSDTLAEGVFSVLWEWTNY